MCAHLKLCEIFKVGGSASEVNALTSPLLLLGWGRVDIGSISSHLTSSSSTVCSARDEDECRQTQNESGTWKMWLLMKNVEFVRQKSVILGLNPTTVSDLCFLRIVTLTWRTELHRRCWGGGRRIHVGDEGEMVKQKKWCQRVTNEFYYEYGTWEMTLQKEWHVPPPDENGQTPPPAALF